MRRLPCCLFHFPISEISRVHCSTRSILKVICHDEGPHTPTLPQDVLYTQKRLSFKGLWSLRYIVGLSPKSESSCGLCDMALVYLESPRVHISGEEEEMVEARKVVHTNQFLNIYQPSRNPSLSPADVESGALTAGSPKGTHLHMSLSSHAFHINVDCPVHKTSP